MTIRNPDGSKANYRVEPLRKKSIADIEKEKAEAKAKVQNKFKKNPAKKPGKKK